MARAGELVEGQYYYAPKGAGYSASIIRVTKGSGSNFEAIGIVLGEHNNHDFYPKSAGGWSSMTERFPATPEQIKYLEDSLAAGRPLPWKEKPKTEDNYLIIN